MNNVKMASSPPRFMCDHSCDNVAKKLASQDYFFDHFVPRCINVEQDHKILTIKFSVY